MKYILGPQWHQFGAQLMINRQYRHVRIAKSHRKKRSSARGSIAGHCECDVIYNTSRRNLSFYIYIYTRIRTGRTPEIRIVMYSIVLMYIIFDGMTCT